jgi:hypothetical protein
LTCSTEKRGPQRGFPNGAVLVEGLADGTLDRLWDGNFKGLSIGLDEDGFDVKDVSFCKGLFVGLDVGLADVGLDVDGVFVGFADMGLDVDGLFVSLLEVGLADVGLDVDEVFVGLAGLFVGLLEVGLDVEGAFIGLADVGLQDVGSNIGLGVQLGFVAVDFKGTDAHLAVSTMLA